MLALAPEVLFFSNVVMISRKTHTSVRVLNKTVPEIAYREGGSRSHQNIPPPAHSRQFNPLEGEAFSPNHAI
jgi:hypothetical protein